jgi:putative FmdB family regulatory protein
MPVYEYKCKKCGERFEVRLSINSEIDEIPCPRCGTTETEKVYSIFSRGSSSAFCAPERFS